MQFQGLEDDGRALADIDEHWYQDKSKPALRKLIDKEVIIEPRRGKEKNNPIDQPFLASLPPHQVFGGVLERARVFN